MAAIKRDSPIQFSIRQPIDLRIRVSDGPHEWISDGFEFGDETVTFVEPGLYRIHIEPSSPTEKKRWMLIMSYGTTVLQPVANKWREAEALATTAKRSGGLDDIRNSLRAWQALGIRSAVARSRLSVGDSLVGRNSTAARDSYEVALAICTSDQDLRCAAEAANNSGFAASLLGDFDPASTRLHQAAEFWRHLSLPTFEGRTLSNLGLLLRQSGDFGSAIIALDRARQLLRGRDEGAYARLLNNLGQYYQSVFENDRALAHFQSALAIFAARREHAVRVRLNLGRTYLQMGRVDLAEGSLTHALNESARTSDEAARAEVLAALGAISIQRGRWDEARNQLNRALVIHRRIRSKRGEASDLHYLGVEAAGRQDFDTASQDLSSAIRIRKEVGLRDEASESIFSLAQLEYRAGNIASARDHIHEAIGMIEGLRQNLRLASLRAAYFARKHRFFDLLVDIASAPADPDQAEQALLASEEARARALLDLIAMPHSAQGLSPQLRERRDLLSSRINLLAGRLSDPIPTRVTDSEQRELDRQRDDLRRRLEILLSESDELQQQIRSVGTGTSRPVSSVGEIQAAMPADSALLEYYLGERGSYLWLIRKNELHWFPLPSRVAIEELANRTADRFGAILERRRSPRAQSAFALDVRQLSATLLGCLRNYRLPRKLILAVDGVLNRVPMEALCVPGMREPLGIAFDVVRAPSAAFLIARAHEGPATVQRRRVLAVADPVFGGGDPRLPPTAKLRPRQSDLPRLPFAADISALRTLVPAAKLRLLQGFDASLHVVQKVDWGEYGLVHFSTHGMIDDRIPELSRVALSLFDPAGRRIPGYLYSSQFARFRLYRSIIVLSSCETALGKEVPGEGLTGFTGNLLSAGASQVILTLSKVDAEASGLLLSEAYRHFFGPTRPTMEHALAQARRTLAQSRRWSDPYYWASFTVIGGPGGAR